MVAHSSALVRRHRALRRRLDAAKKDRKVHRFYEDFEEGLTSGHIKPEEYTLHELFDNLVDDGRELRETYNPKYRDSYGIYESGDAVTTTDFANITGQIVYSRFLQDYNKPSLLWPQLFETIPTEFSGEKIPGIGEMGDNAESVGEGKPYPFVGLSEQWVETPETIKRGLIVPVTKEAVFFDRTGQVLRKAAQVGDYMGINKEKRCLDVALGITTVYRRNGGTAQATYGNTHTNGDGDNLAASNALADWTDVETAELLFDALTDPETGEFITIMPNAIIVPTALKHTAKRILNATEVQHGAPGATADTVLTRSGSPIGNYMLLTSPYVKGRTSSDSTWFIGEPKRAFAYMENWPATITQAPPNSHDEFHRDIVSQYKISERGAPTCLDWRYMVKATG